MLIVGLVAIGLAQALIGALRLNLSRDGEMYVLLAIFVVGIVGAGMIGNYIETGTFF